MSNKQLTLGSLFDGSGGFPLGGLLAGIEPLWASEIEPFPIRVTTKRMRFVKHYGDIKKMDGAKAEPVDIITFGSPCQDMSIAGRREGLDGSRSNLFYEAVRIVKEMRCATNGKYPRYIVWENVPGAFSSNKGEDFRCVLEAIGKIKNDDFSVPECKKWLTAGEIVGDDFSIAWRVLDAQYWGVPQRRKRIYLVADFAGGSAGKILFDSEGLSGYSKACFGAWKRTARCAEEGTYPSGIGIDGYNGNITDEVAATLGVNCGMSTGRNGVCLMDQGGERIDVLEEKTSTLRAEAHHPPCVMDSAGFCTEHSAKARSIGYEKEKSPTLRAGTVPAAIAVENRPQDSRAKISEDGIVQTLDARMGMGGGNVPLLLKVRSGCEGGGKGSLVQEDKSATLGCNNDQTLFEPKAYGICSKNSNSMKSDNPKSGVYEADTSRTLDTSNQSPSKNQGGIAVVCVDQGGGKSSCSVSKEVSPTLACTHGGEPAVCVQGSVIGRDDKNGPNGGGINEDVSFTLNATDKHAVAYGIDRAAFNQGQNALYNFAVEEELEPTMVAKGPGAVAEPTYESSKSGYLARFSKEIAYTLTAEDYKDPPCINANETVEYTVRRLTPTECARLQGFPDWWCADLETEKPTNDDILFWHKVFEEYRLATAPDKKTKTGKQIIKWLKAPYSDSAEYKMWGNGVCLNIVAMVMFGIKWAYESEKIIGNE
ncbi:MAG: DNA cytosine methyltransferase [Firmicutes bacterium]|nr:DNA cytosine methyltransferase [Bacillota bacterium]